MDSLPIEEVDTLKILGFCFDCELTWSPVINNMSTCRCQRMGALYHFKDFLGRRGLAVAFRLFVRLVCEYGSVAIMGASATHLPNLDSIQKMVEKLSGCKFPSLHSHHKASAVGLLCKLLDFRGQGFYDSYVQLLLVLNRHILIS